MPLALHNAPSVLGTAHKLLLIEREKMAYQRERSDRIPQLSQWFEANVLMWTKCGECIACKLDPLEDN